MSHAQLMELEFEENLCSELGDRGWLYEQDGKPTGWDVGLAMVPNSSVRVAVTVAGATMLALATALALTVAAEATVAEAATAPATATAIRSFIVTPL